MINMRFSHSVCRLPTFLELTSTTHRYRYVFYRKRFLNLTSIKGYNGPNMNLLLRSFDTQKCPFVYRFSLIPTRSGLTTIYVTTLTFDVTSLSSNHKCSTLNIEKNACVLSI